MKDNTFTDIVEILDYIITLILNFLIFIKRKFRKRIKRKIVQARLQIEDINKYLTQFHFEHIIFLDISQGIIPQQTNIYYV